MVFVCLCEVKRDADSEWVYQKMLALAKRADDEAGWDLLREDAAWDATDLIYDRFGPRFSDVDFKWHVDAMTTDPSRRVSLVTYFTEPSEFEGGTLQMKIPGGDEVTPGGECGPGEVIIERRYGMCSAVAFPSSTLWHNVTPVTAGERRSMLLIAGHRPTPKKAMCGRSSPTET